MSDNKQFIITFLYRGYVAAVVYNWRPSAELARESAEMHTSAKWDAVRVEEVGGLT